MMWILRIAHTLRLRHIDLLGEMLVEKVVINIKLTKVPLAMECNVEHSTDDDGIDHGIENLVKINIRLLVKAFSNKPSFIPSNRGIEILFDAKNLFIVHYVRGNERPSAISDKIIILILHGLNPL